MGLWLRPQRGRREEEREERGGEEREGEGPGPQQIFWPGTAPRRNWHGRMLFSIENVTQQRAISSDRQHEAVQLSFLAAAIRKNNCRTSRIIKACPRHTN